MSRRNSDNAPAIDIYVGLMFVSLAAVSTGLTFLLLELQKYEFKLSP